jgi:hypothetical protein
MKPISSCAPAQIRPTSRVCERRMQAPLPSRRSGPMDPRAFPKDDGAGTSSSAKVSLSCDILHPSVGSKIACISCTDDNFMPHAPESHALVSNKCFPRKQHLTGPDHLRCSNEIRDILEIVADARAPTRPLACKVAELFPRPAVVYVEAV